MGQGEVIGIVIGLAIVVMYKLRSTKEQAGSFDLGWLKRLHDHHTTQLLIQEASRMAFTLAVLIIYVTMCQLYEEAAKAEPLDAVTNFALQGGKLFFAIVGIYWIFRFSLAGVFSKSQSDKGDQR